MPEGVSAMRGLALPSQPLRETPLVVMAPRLATSTKSPYSRPAANVPDAVVTGFFMARPPRFTAMRTFVGAVVSGSAFSIPAIYHTTFAASNTGPSTQARFLPSTVSTTHDRQAPTPHAMRFSKDTSQNTPASAAMRATILMSGSGPHTAT